MFFYKRLQCRESDIPCRNPGVDYCKNAIQINEINGKQHRISCSSSPASLVSTAYIQLQ